LCFRLAIIVRNVVIGHCVLLRSSSKTQIQARSTLKLKK